MADLTRTIKVLLSGQDLDMQKTFINAEKDFDQFSSKVQSATAPLADFGANVAKAEAALIAMAVAGVAYSVNEFKNFEDVMLKVKGVIGANSEEYAQLTALTKDLGESTRYTATEAAQGLEFLALAGFKTTDALTALPEVLKLAQAAGMDLGRAADIVTNIMTGYGVAVNDLTKSNDVLTATFTNSNTNLEQLGQAFKMAGPVAKSLGLELDETASILGVLGNAGYQAEMGGTALRNILLALVAPAGNFGKLAKELGVDTTELGIDIADSANALKSLGVNVKDTNGELLPFADIMDQMKTGLEKIQDPADRTAILIEIFGKRGGPQMAALLEQGSDAVRGLQDRIGDLGGITSKIAADMESEIGGALRSFRSGFSSVAIEIGEAASKDIAPAVRGLAEVFRTISDEVDAGTFDPILNAIGEFAGNAEQLFLDIAKNLPEALAGVDFSNLIKSFQDLGGEIGNALDALFGGKLDLTTVSGLEEAVQRIIDIFAGMTNFTKGFVEGLEPLLRTIGEIAENFGDMDEAGQQAFGNVSGWAKNINVLFSSLDTLKNVLAGVGAVLVAGPLINGLKGLYSALELIGAAISLGLTADIAALGTSFTLLGTAAPIAIGVGAVGAALWNIADAIKEIKANNVKFLPSWDDLTPGTQAFLSLFLGGEQPDPVVLAFKPETQTLDDLLTLPIFNEGLDAKIQQWVYDPAAQQTLDDLLTLPVFNEGLDILINPVVPKVTDEVIAYTWTDADGNVHFSDSPGNSANEKEIRVPLSVVPSVDETAKDKTKTDIQVLVAEITSSAETLQKSIEWEAKVKISQAETDLKKVEAAFKSVDNTITETSNLIAEMFDALSSGNLDTLDKWLARDVVEQQLEMQRESFELSQKMIEKQIELMDMQKELRESGEGLLTIKIADSVTPALKLVLMEILNLTQIELNEYVDQYLVGIA